MDTRKRTENVLANSILQQKEQLGMVTSLIHDQNKLIEGLRRELDGVIEEE